MTYLIKILIIISLFFCNFNFAGKVFAENDLKPKIEETEESENPNIPRPSEETGENPDETKRGTEMKEGELEEVEPEKIGEEPDICGEIIFNFKRDSMEINLEDALRIVLENNFDIKIFNARKESEKWFFYQSITDFLPDINYLYTLDRLDGTVLVGGVVPVEILETPVESDFFLNWNLDSVEIFNYKEQKFIFKSAKRNLEFTKDEALLEAARGYYTLLANKIGIDILKINIKQIEEQLKINQQKLEAGIGTKFDVLRAQADLALAEQQLIVARNVYRLSQATLANTLGIPVFVQLVPDESEAITVEYFDDCFTLDLAREIAINTRDDLAALRFDIEAARQRRNAGYSVYIPSINLRGTLANQGTVAEGFFPFKSLGFVVRWDGLESLGLRGFTEVKALKAALEETKLVFENQARTVQQNLVSSFYSTIAARELIDATDLELKSAEESRRLSVVRLRAGIGTFIDVLQAQTAFTTARINNINALLGYNIAQIQLLFEMGVISVDNILEGFNAGSGKPNCAKFAPEEEEEGENPEEDKKQEKSDSTEKDDKPELKDKEEEKETEKSNEQQKRETTIR